MSATDHEAAIRRALAMMCEEPFHTAEVAEQEWLRDEARAALDALVGLLRQAERENGALRGLVATVVKPCHYCGAETMAKCPRGFPGCGLADDLMLGDEVLSGDVLKRLREAEARAERAEQEVERAHAAMAHWLGEANNERDRVRVLEEALLIAQKGLRTLIRGGYIEQARGALADSEERAALAATSAPPGPSETS